MADGKRTEAEEETAAPASEPAEKPVDGATDGAEEAADKVLAELDELGEAKRERDEYLELAQRTRADFENYRKRAAREAEEARARAKAELVAQLIPAVDNLERALQSANDSNALSDGVKLVHEELRTVLERAGVEAYDPAGERFDPAWHEALSTHAVEGVEPGEVLETLDKGYRLDGQVLRAARVVVSE